ncbi:hypothetical protein JXJ21_08185 [candidate division KSB1 bacterium]|nr:hypothetical protein [candidate division KSB1 bacterium]
MKPAEYVLKTSKKLEIVYRLFMGKPLHELIDNLSTREVIEFQRFVWDRTVELGIKIRGTRFDRREITRKMIPTPNYQRQQNCNECIYYCKGTHCIHSNPSCARNKIKEHVKVMGEVFQGYVTSAKQQDNLLY